MMSCDVTFGRCILLGIVFCLTTQRFQFAYNRSAYYCPTLCVRGGFFDYYERLFSIAKEISALLTITHG